ncbi:MAG: hypothetical protein ABIN61_07550 [candidate division WOR-3 bacterium]
MILFLISFLSVPLEGNGEAFIGYYPSKDTLYNTDVSITICSYLLRFEDRLDFFGRYSSYLEMAEQEGKVVLDPYFASYSLVCGFVFKGSLFLSIYCDHSCRHIIDRKLEEGKVVFNSLNLGFSTIKDHSYRFGENHYLISNYIFYPQGIFVDWLNSRPFYRHRFLIEGGKKINSFTEISLFGEYTLSNDKPRKVYYMLAPEIEFFSFKGDRAFYAFIKYYLKAKGPLRSPETLFFFGIGYTFFTPCK